MKAWKASTCSAAPLLSNYSLVKLMVYPLESNVRKTLFPMSSGKERQMVNYVVQFSTMFNPLHTMRYQQK